MTFIKLTLLDYDDNDDFEFIGRALVRISDIQIVEEVVDPDPLSESSKEHFKKYDISYSYSNFAPSEITLNNGNSILVAESLKHIESLINK